MFLLSGKDLFPRAHYTGRAGKKQFRNNRRIKEADFRKSGAGQRFPSFFTRFPAGKKGKIRKQKSGPVTGSGNLVSSVQR